MLKSLSMCKTAINRPETTAKLQPNLFPVKTVHWCIVQSLLFPSIKTIVVACGRSKKAIRSKGSIYSPFNCQFSLWDRLRTTWTICLSNCPFPCQLLLMNFISLAWIISTALNTSLLLSYVLKENIFLGRYPNFGFDVSYRPPEFVWECFLCETFSTIFPCVTQQTFFLCVPTKLNKSFLEWKNNISSSVWHFSLYRLWKCRWDRQPQIERRSRGI